ncbi:ABC transporter ATP-binding protein [Cohnella hashimotonis]|uniref:ABC transporter ATP-binding protein n=1 Tax=Cohnella hashimotonis TaxID=2826895 RepID=A0ABT6TQT3_9BACL|nr:ABC transporter ATP-binding protein [Cohnella hashimotonis]MDI4648177.1 ABC transporter ATP-binding protein [Cohnella hashimotonis]
MTMKTSPVAPTLKIFFTRVLPLLWRLSPRLFAASVAVHLLQAAIPSLQLYWTQALIDAVAAAARQEPGGWSRAGLLLGLQGATFALEHAIRFGGAYVLAATKQKANFELNRSVIDKCARLPLVYFDQPDYYDKLQRVSKGVEYRGVSILEHGFQLLQSVFTIAGFLAILASLHYSLALGMLLLVIPIFLVNIRIGQQKYRQIVHQTPASRRAEYFAELLKGREAAKEMRVFDLFGYMKEQWRTLYWVNAGERIALEKRSLLKQFWTETFSMAVTTGTAFYLLFLTVRGALTLGHFAALTQALATTRHQLIIAVVNLSRIHEEMLFMNEWLAFLALPEETGTERDDAERRKAENGEADEGETKRRKKASREADRSEPIQGDAERLFTERSGGSGSCRIPVSSASGRDPAGISVRGLTFTYPGQAEPTLRDISFDAPAGRTIAIVGGNGAGKSTLVKCIMGLYEPEEGAVSLGGTRIGAGRERYGKFGAVFQDFVRFQFSAQQSIGLGDPERLEDLARAETAASRAGAGEFIARLPQGFATPLGAMFQDGRELSYGQWQKIALSRAFFKDAPYIVLDEPTSAMDPIAEAQLFERFARLAAGKTTLMVSHRLGSCRFADLILVLRDGRLVERGTHDELMRDGGEYARMYATQAKWYLKMNDSRPLASSGQG